jgi:signal transduction histidine kinase
MRAWRDVGMIERMGAVEAPPAQLDARASPPPPLRRRLDAGVVAGVCAGLAEHFRAPVWPVRAAMVALVAVGGIGVAVYVLAWTLVPAAAGSERRIGRWGTLRPGLLFLAGVVVGLGVLHHLASGVRFGNALWPAVLFVAGLSMVWRPIAAAGRPSARGRVLLGEQLRRAFHTDGPRLVIGVLLVAFASAGLLHVVGVQHSFGEAVAVVAIIATMLGLLTVPWFVRMARSLSLERAARIREQERAELAAHLHDSVLQTLALIQKRAGDAREVAGLARRQERELRSWLLGRPAGTEQESLARALERAASEVEELHGVPIEVVTVGDSPLGGGLAALVQAAREAMTNAAKFARCEHVDLYAEVDGERVEVFVRDRGVGFDPEQIPLDRRGVRESIVGRMERHRGRATVHSQPGEGTEVELVMEGAAAT